VPIDTWRRVIGAAIAVNVVAAGGVVVVVTALAAGGAAAGAGDPSFAPGGPVLGGLDACAVATADFNDDGNADLGIVNCSSHSAAVLLADGAGGFRLAGDARAEVGDGPSEVVADDFQADGNADLAVLGQTSRNFTNVTVLLGNGRGGLRAAPGSPIKFDGSPTGVTAADVNADRNVDLLVPVYQGRVAVLLGVDSGRFASAPGSPLTVAGHPHSAAVADFDGDRKADLAVGSESRISILLGNGAGGFRPAAGSPIKVTGGSENIAVADFNGDAKPDLAASAEGGEVVTILLGDGVGGFHRGPGSPIKVAGDLLRLVVADFNDDRNPDLALTGEDITILLGNRSGRFRPAAYSPFAVVSSRLAAADLNGDRKFDLAVTSIGVLTILFQTASTPAVVAGRAVPGKPDAVFSTRGRIYRLAADGNRAAVVTTVKGTCGRVVVWTAPGRKSTSFKPGYFACNGDGVTELALGGGQVAWIEAGGGNSLELDVVAARLSGRAAKEIDEAFNGDRAGFDPIGRWVGQLRGAGPLLAYNRWEVVCSHEDPVYDYCNAWEVVEKKLVRISAGRTVVVKAGAESYPLSAVGGGRMAVEPAGVITVLSSRGSTLASIQAVAENPPRAIALSRTRLVVGRTFTLDVHDPASGTKTKSVALGPAAGLQLAGVNSRLALFRDSGRLTYIHASPGNAAVLRSSRKLVLGRLSDGKLIELPLARGAAAGVIGAALTEAGLFYAYNVPRAAAKGRIVFEPTAKLLARF
jgi:FG-GAP-like repeat